MRPYDRYARSLYSSSPHRRHLYHIVGSTEVILCSARIVTSTERDCALQKEGEEEERHQKAGLEVCLGAVSVDNDYIIVNNLLRRSNLRHEREDVLVGRHGQEHVRASLQERPNHVVVRRV